jgi:hypothetical protein
VIHIIGIGKILHLTPFFIKTHSEKLIGTVTESIPKKFLAIKDKLKENNQKKGESEERVFKK